MVCRWYLKQITVYDEFQCGPDGCIPRQLHKMSWLWYFALYAILISVGECSMSGSVLWILTLEH